MGCGVATPPVRAALEVVRDGRRVGEYLVTDVVQGRRPVRELLAAGPSHRSMPSAGALAADARAALLAELVALVVRLQGRGIFHLDVAPGNLFWEDGRGFAFVDLDNLIVVAGPSGLRYRLARWLDCATLLFKLEPFLGADELAAFRTAYAIATGAEMPARVPRVLRSSRGMRFVQRTRRVCTALGVVR